MGVDQPTADPAAFEIEAAEVRPAPERRPPGSWTGHAGLGIGGGAGGVGATTFLAGEFWPLTVVGVGVDAVLAGSAMIFGASDAFHAARARLVLRAPFPSGAVHLAGSVGIGKYHHETAPSENWETGATERTVTDGTAPSFGGELGLFMHVSELVLGPVLRLDYVDESSFFGVGFALGFEL